MEKNEMIGNRIKLAREEQNITQESLAEAIGVDKSTINRYEHGKIKTIKIPVIMEISRALNVNPDWIICKSEYIRDKPTMYKEGSDVRECLFPDESDLLRSYRLLSAEGKEYIRQTMAMALSAYRAK